MERKTKISSVFGAMLLLGFWAGLAGAATTAAESKGQQSVLTYADTVAWDGKYDVVVVGFGGAGAVAAKTAADKGARVLLIDKAPEGHEGGNTRYAGQLFVYGQKDADATLAYYKALMGSRKVPDDMLAVYARGIASLEDTVVDEFGADRSRIKDWTGTSYIGTMSPEYPEFPGAQKITMRTITDQISNGALWRLLRKNVTDRADKIDVWFASPALSLIQDPSSKTVLGVAVQRQGKVVNIQAARGVVMALGGFENSRHLVETYLGLSRSAPVGSLYNTGDGIRMAMDAGADFWHMEVYEGISGLGGVSLAVPEGDRASRVIASVDQSGSFILIGNDGTRYLREDETARHGHIRYSGVWTNPKRPERSFIIADRERYDALKAAKAIPDVYEKRVVTKAETIESLAKAIAVPPATLAKTVADFNKAAVSGIDPQFGREAKSMKAIEKAPYYAIEVIANILNTQGGPMRNARAEVLDKDGKPIPHLYSAGEFGGITSLQYQGGGNLAECIIFGKIAGQNAAVEKAPLPAYKAPEKVASNPVFMPGKVSDLKMPGAVQVPGPNEYIGQAEGMSGTIAVKVTMAGDKIEKVEVLKQTESAVISDPALQKIPAEIVSRNSPDVDAVSGATMTSRGIMNAVKDALSKVKR